MYVLNAGTWTVKLTNNDVCYKLSVYEIMKMMKMRCSLVPRWGLPLGLGGPPSHGEEGYLGYEPTRDLPAGGDLGVGLQLEEAMFPTTIR